MVAQGGKGVAGVNQFNYTSAHPEYDAAISQMAPST